MNPQDVEIVASTIARAQVKIVTAYLQAVERGVPHDMAAAAMVRCFEETNRQTINIVQSAGAAK